MTQSAVAAPTTPAPPLFPPEPLELVIKGRDDDPVAYACPKCGMLFLLKKDIDEGEREHLAGQASAHCVKQCACGNALDHHYQLRCKECREKAEKEKERARFEKAERLAIEAWTDTPVYWEGHIGGLGDGFFSNIDEVIDYCAEEGLELPEYVWTCSSHEFKLDAGRFIEQELERQEMYDDASEDISEEALTRLQAYMDVWSKEQHLTGWQPDHARAVLLRAEAAKAS
jgi:hypothetical protein